MLDNTGRFLVLNGQLKQSDLYKSVSESKGSRVYEVIRLVKGVPLFLEDHYDRMSKSLGALGLNMEINLQELAKQIELLKTTTDAENFNAKVVIDNNDNTQNCLLYISKSYYPAQAEFEAGVATGLFSWERENPNIKIWKDDYKAAVGKAITDKEVFEVLLVNGRGEITEGSKSNAFFLIKGQVLTAPGNVVLKGITRKYIIEACRNAGLEVVEKPVTIDMLSEMEAAFISGTSINVLPVSRIEQYRLASGSNTVIRSIRMSYDRILEAYINERH